jgi:hypothetical protein
MTVVVNDTLTDAAGVLLQNHTPEVGGPITKHSASGGTSDGVITDANSLRSGGSVGGLLLFRWAGVPASPDYTSEMNLTRKTFVTSNSWGVMARFDNAASYAGYNLNYQYSNASWNLLKYVGGVGTAMATAVGQTLVDGTTYNVKLVVSGGNPTTVRGLVNDVEIFNVTDSTSPLTAAGTLAIRGGGALTTNTTGLHIADVKLTDTGSASPPVNTAAPVVTTDGTPATTETVTCSTGTWTNTPTSYAYQWKHDLGAGYVNITGAGNPTTSAYTLQLADEGRNVKCTVTATNAAGSTSADSNVIVPAVTAPLASTDVSYRLTGGAANSNPANSTGGAESSISAGADLFATVPNGTGISGEVSYACITVHNSHSTFSMNVKAWISTQLTAGLTLAMGWAPEAAGVAPQAVASRLTAPTGVAFTAPANLGAAIDGGSVGPGQGKALWLRLTVAPLTPSIASDPWVISTQETQL